MKILKTEDRKYKSFIKKTGPVFLLLLVAVATGVAIFAGTSKINKTPPKSDSSQINLSGDENNWTNSALNQNAQQTDTEVSSMSLSSQSQAQLSSSKPFSYSSSPKEQSSSQISAQILYISPVNAEILNKYSGNKPVKSLTMGDWRLHTGVDYKAQKGTSVKASAEGIVSKIYNDAMWGTSVEIEHEDKKTSIYRSLSDKVFVEKGQKVTSGQVIGTVGNTAKIESAEDSHLHFEIKQNDKFLDPESVITKPIE